MKYRYILNPGDMLDVTVSADRAEAERAAVAAGVSARLYSCVDGKQWREFRDGMWWPCNRENLPIKVLEAGREP